MRFQMSARWLRICALAFVSILAASCGTGDGEESVQGSADSIDNTGLRLVFRDDFGGPAAALRGKGVAAMSPPAPLPAGDWVVETGYGQNGWGNDEWQRYTNSIDNVFIADGNLVLRARCATAPACGKRDDSITSGKVITKNRLNVRYGRIRARIKMPSGLGMWPAFWTLGSDIDQRPWPDAGEIDIVEMHYFYSDIFTTHFTTHWSGPRYTPSTRPVCASGVGSSLDPSEEENCQTATKVFATPLTDGYHIFELDWNENRIVGKIDGITYFEQGIDPATMEEFLKDHYLILNVAVGGTLGGPFGPAMSAADWGESDQTDMLVDWVEVFERVPPSQATLIDESGNNLRYNRIINSAEFNGAFVESKLKSQAVPALVGSSVLELKYSTSISKNGGVPASFSGAIFDFNNLNLSSFTHFTFSLDTSRFPNFADIGIGFEDSQLNQVLVRTSDYTPIATSGNWKTYSIPLADLAGVDMNDIVVIGFFNPFDSGDNLIGGTLYVDDIVFTIQACTASPAVAFDAIDYNPATVAARVTVNDLCAANKLGVVKIENAGDEIFVGVKLDAAGNGDAIVNLVTEASACPTDDEFAILALTGSAITATYKEGTPEETSAVAGINPSVAVSELAGDELYFYATDPGQPLAFIPDAPVANSFNFSVFGSGSTLNGSFADSTFNPVFEVRSGNGYGTQVAQIVLINLPAGFPANAKSINFKFKNVGSPNNTINVEFGGDGVATTVRSIDLLDATRSTLIGDGWYEISVPMSEFPDVGGYTFVAFTSAPDPITSVPFSFRITDIFLEEKVGNLGSECDAPAIPAAAPSEDPADVISLFSDTYSDVVVDTWSTVWDSTEVVDTALQGNAIKRYENLGFAGIETVVMPVDASSMTNFRIDVWSTGISTLRIKLVDFGGDGFDVGGNVNDTEAFVDIPVNSAEWVNVDVDLADFVAAGLNPALNDISQYILESIGGSGKLFIDNVYFYDDGSGGGPGDGELLTNGDFEASSSDKAPWINAGGIATNNYYQVDVISPDPGQPFLVNLSQVVPITPSETYVLTFRARASVDRTMIAGIGLNGGPGGCCDFRNNSEIVPLTTEWQAFSYTLQAVDDGDGSPFGDNVSRVLFDMNAEAGTVNIDDVSLKVDSGGGGGSGTEIATDGDFEAGDLSINWFVVPNGTNGTATADNTVNNGGSWSAKLSADENIGPSLVIQQNNMGVGTVMPGDNINISFDVIGMVTAGCAINAQLISNGGGGISGSLSPPIDVGTDLSNWASFGFDATTAGPVDVNGVLLEVIVGCGAGTGGVVDVNLDNVSVSIQ